MDYKNDVRIIKALTDENRLAILHMLQDGSSRSRLFRIT